MDRCKRRRPLYPTRSIACMSPCCSEVRNNGVQRRSASGGTRSAATWWSTRRRPSRRAVPRAAPMMDRTTLTTAPAAPGQTAGGVLPLLGLRESASENGDAGTISACAAARSVGGHKYMPMYARPACRANRGASAIGWPRRPGVCPDTGFCPSTPRVYGSDFMKLSGRSSVA